MELILFKMNLLKQHAIRIIGKLIPNGVQLLILRGPLKGKRYISGAAAGHLKGLSVIFNLSESHKYALNALNIPDNSVYLDIGANVGLHSILYSKTAKEVHAFEPLRKNLEYFQKMVSINKIKNIKILPCAVLDFEGLAKFEEGDSSATGKISRNGKIEVNVITLDKYIKRSKISPDIMKIDVEGAEVSVLKGARNLIKIFKPLIFLETHGDKARKECFRILYDNGYKKYILLERNESLDANEYLITP